MEIYDFVNYKIETKTVDEVQQYVILNKNTGIIEVETRLLPQAVAFARELDGQLDAIKAEMEEVTKLDKVVYSH